VVSFRVGGNPDILNESEGDVLAEPQDVTGLIAKTIDRLLRSGGNPSPKADLSRFSEKRILGQYLGMLGLP